MDRIVLAGLGHTHLEIVRRWRDQPVDGATLTVVTPDDQAAYSGMWSGVLCGDYAEAEATVDAIALCRAAGVELVLDRVTAVRPTTREIVTANCGAVPYDLLSVNVGSVIRPVVPAVIRPRWWIGLKPLRTLRDRIAAALPKPSVADAGSPRATRERGESESTLVLSPTGGPSSRLQIVIIGDGVAAVEVALCLAGRRSRPRRDDQVASVERDESGRWNYRPDRDTARPMLSIPPQVTVVGRGDEPVKELSPSARKLVQAALAERGIIYRGGEVVVGPAEMTDQLTEHRAVRLACGTTMPADLVLEATGAAPRSWLAEEPWTHDERGFPRVGRTLQSRDDARVFFVGDAAGFSTPDLPGGIAKAGVHAVREAPILWANLAASLRGGRLSEYQPQETFLKLLNTGDGRAIADWHGYAMHNRLAWWWKRWLDRRFVAKYKHAEHSMPRPD